MGNKLWHDLIEDSNDLPEKYIKRNGLCIYVLIMCNYGHIISTVYWCIDKAFTYNDVIKWCYVDELINIDKNGK